MSRQKPKEFWEQHIKAFRGSKMSQKEYCLTNGIKTRALQYHMNKQRNKPSVPHGELEKCQNGWLPITVIDEPLRTRYSGGIRLQLSKITIEAEQGCDGIHLAHMLRAAGVIC